MATYLISELAQRAGMTTTTLRFYEQEGLLPATRSAAGYRVYDDEAARRLEFIVGAKHIGLALAEIRELLAAWDTGECTDLRDRLRPLIAARIADAQHRSAELAAVTRQLTAALSHLDGPMASGRCEPACCIPAAGAPPARPPDPAVPMPSAAMPVQPATVPQVTGCALPVAAQEDRLGEWRALLADAAGREPIGDGTRFRFPAPMAGRIAALAAAEADCCAFLEFTLRVAHGEAVLDVHAPAEMLGILGSELGLV
jgi:DNA-binding transcriptional MerR regulator